MTSLPRRDHMAWLVNELEYLQIDVRLNSLMDADAIRAAHPDVVVLATSTRPRNDGFQVPRPDTVIPGHDLAHAHNSRDLFDHGSSGNMFCSLIAFDASQLIP